MFKVQLQWVIIWVFAISFVAAIAAEIILLVRRHQVSVLRSAGYSVTSSGLALFIGSWVPFTIVGTIVALAWSGDIDSVGISEPVLGIALFAAVAIPIAFLLVTKRIMLSLFRIRNGRDAWWSAAFLSAVTLLVAFAPPIVYYILIL